MKNTESGYQKSEEECSDKECSPLQYKISNFPSEKLL